jgi:hypothetical protein
MPATAPYVSVLTDQWIKYSVTRDPLYDSLSLDPENAGPWANRISALSTQLDVSTDISAFKARGGKLLLAHGLADVLVSTRATEQYYQRLQARMGLAEVDGFVRYYEVAGLGHAVSSVFNATWDSLTALEQWAEKPAPPPRGRSPPTRPACPDAPGRCATTRSGRHTRARETSTSPLRSGARTERGEKSGVKRQQVVSGGDPDRA